MIIPSSRDDVNKLRQRGRKVVVGEQMPQTLLILVVGGLTIHDAIATSISEAN